MKIALTSVFVPDPVAAYKFYTNVLGFASKLYMPEAYLAIVVSPEDPDGTALLLEPNGNPIAKTYQEGLYNSGIPVIVFSTDDIEKEYERLKQLGVVFRKTPTKIDAGTEAIFEDGFGNLIMLFHP